MKNLHIAPIGSITDSYIKFINNHFDSKDHLFLVFENGFREVESQNNVKVISKELINIVSIIFEMNKSGKIFLHGLFNYKIMLLLLLQPWLLKKCYWIVWGGDLYFYRVSQTTLKRKAYEYVRAFVIKRIGHIVSLVKGDYDLAKKWYEARGIYHHGSYINPISKRYLDSLPVLQKNQDNPIIIQLGNSADPSNNHIDAMKKLINFKDENLQIIVPLSYGDKSYGDKSYTHFVIEQGKKIFGDKFIALTEFLLPEEYGKYLNSVDIAIFNNDRQQALGNIYALLYLNKKVYIRSDTPMWSHFKEKFDIDMNEFLLVENINFEEFIQRNGNQKSKIENVFEESYLLNIWKNIFEES